MVTLGSGFTKKGDNYTFYSEESDGCYRVQLITVSNLKEIWTVLAKDWIPEILECQLQGPMEKCKKGPFGRKFLEKQGKLIFQIRC